MNVVCLNYYLLYIPCLPDTGIVFDTYDYLIFSLPLPSLLCWVSFSIPMLACNAPLWSGCPSLLPGIVFDTHQPVLVSSPPSHRYRFQYPRLCGGILLLLFYCRVSFSIPIILSQLLSSPPSHRYRFQYPRLCRIIHIADSLYYWVSFSIPMRR